MDSIFQNHASAGLPEKPMGLTSIGNPTNGSKYGGTPATDIGAWWYYMVTQEIINAIKGGGLDPNGDVVDQLNASIDKRIKTATSELQKEVMKAVQMASGTFVPTGMILPFAGSVCPEHFYRCDGSAKSRDADARLFAVIGTTYGAGNGTTTFNLPDFTDRTFWGATSGFGQKVAAGLPNIKGEIGVDDRMTYYLTGAFYKTGTRHDTGTQYSEYGFDVGFDASRYNPIYGGSNTVQPPAIKTMFCIAR